MNGKNMIILGVLMFAVTLSLGAVSAVDNSTLQQKVTNATTHKTVSSTLVSTYTRIDTGNRTVYSEGQRVRISWTTYYNPTYVHMIMKIRASAYVALLSMYITKTSPNTLRKYGTLSSVPMPAKTIYTSMTASYYYWNFIRPRLISGNLT